MEKTKETEQFESIAQGDERAFEKLFKQYFSRVKYFIAGLVQDEVAAEDLAQDTFVKIWVMRASLGKVENINAYLYKLSKNMALQYIRRQLLENRYEENQIAVHPAEDAVDSELENRICTEELNLFIRATIEKMPPQRQKIYKMSRYDGKSNEEIANELSINKRTVENHLTRALTDIRGTLKHLDLVLALFFLHI